MLSSAITSIHDVRCMACTESNLEGDRYSLCFARSAEAVLHQLMTSLVPVHSILSFSGSLAVLKLSMVTPDDSGEYTVVAENNYGKVCGYDSCR